MMDRRKSVFPERLSIRVIWIAGVGAFLVLLDPSVTLTFYGQVIKIGGDGFSSELKGAVITIMLIGGWTAVMSFWLGASDSMAKQQASMARIAEAQPSASVQTTPVQTDTVNVAATTANVTGETKP